MHSGISRIVLVPKIYRRGVRGANGCDCLMGARRSEVNTAYGILQFIMRHTYLFIAILGVCLVMAGQAAKQPPKSKPAAAAAPSQPQPPSDEERMKKTAEATIDWDSSTTRGARVDVLLSSASVLHRKAVAAVMV